MKFVVDANTMTRKQEIALEDFLDKGKYDWECFFEKGE